MVTQGNEQQPVVIIDDFVAQPQRLIDDARHKAFTQMGPYYPGVRAAADASYLADTVTTLESVLRDVFEIDTGARLVECNYSLVTTPPENLKPIQCLPHYDTTDAGRIALLHYLCPPEAGGTAFYRHLATGYETITPERFAHYRQTLSAEAQRDGLPAQDYFSGDSHQFVQIAAYPAVFNRVLIYRGLTLHSGLIPPHHNFSDQPAAGRLTVNTFLAKKT